MNPPGSKSELERRITSLEKKYGLGIARTRLYFLAEVFCALLGTSGDNIPGYVVKGGVALQFMFFKAARTSEDLDINTLGERDTAEALIANVQRTRWNDWTTLLLERHYMERVLTERCLFGMDYRGRRVGKLSVDLRSEHSIFIENMKPEPSLVVEAGFPEPPEVPAADPHHILADKLHAVTRPATPERDNERYRDIIDIMQIDANATVNRTRVRDLVVKVFEESGSHEWPPLFKMPPDWVTPLLRIAREMNLPTQNEHEFERFMQGFIHKVDAAKD
jgi:hypothetical protein